MAPHVEGDRATFRHCRLLGNQDTLYLAIENSRQYYQDCYIEGTTDFVFGSGTAVFEGCTIHSKANPDITASPAAVRAGVFELQAHGRARGHQGVPGPDLAAPRAPHV